MYAIKDTTAQSGGTSGNVFSAICGMQIPRFTSSKPSEFSFASDEKFIRRPTTSFARRYLSPPAARTADRASSRMRAIHSEMRR